jgi:hypothetical protein
VLGGHESKVLLPVSLGVHPTVFMLQKTTSKYEDICKQSRHWILAFVFEKWQCLLETNMHLFTLGVLLSKRIICLAFIIYKLTVW